MAVTLAVNVQKGGTGKTITAVTLAQAAAIDGKKVLVVDMDPQRNASFVYLGAREDVPGVTDLLAGADIREVIQRSTIKTIDMIASSADLAVLTTKRGSAARLRRALEPIQEDYDIIIIDTPSMATEHVFEALAAADMLIIPIEADESNRLGMFQTIALAMQIQELSNPDLVIKGAVLTRYLGQANVNKHFAGVIEDSANRIDIPVLGVIRNCAKLKETLSNKRSVYEVDPKCNAAVDYWNVYEKIFKRD